MIFQLDTYIVELEAPAQYPYEPSTELIQAKDKSASGITHVESFEVQTDTDIYSFKDTSDGDYQKIMAWFINTANGMMNEFSLTNDHGVTKTVRFTTARIKFTQNSFGLWNGSFTVESIQ